MNRILIIDDDDQLRNSFFRLLTDEHYRVETAASGEQGLEMIRKEFPDLGFGYFNPPKEKWGQKKDRNPFPKKRSGAKKRTIDKGNQGR